MPRSILSGSLTLALALGALVAIAACSEDKTLRIEKIEPKSGPPHGGDWVTIEGNGFQSSGARNVRIYFGEREATQINITNDRTIKVMAPAGSAGDSVDIHLFFEDGRDKKFEEAYTYVEEKRMDVDDLVGGNKKDD